MSAESITIGITNDHKPVGLDVGKVFGSRLLIQGDSGSGKSVMVRRVAESTMGMLPWFIIDIEGEYSTLREVGEVLVLGGDHGDAPLHPDTAGEFARQLRSAGVNVVFDLSELDSITEQRQWVRAFLDELSKIKGAPRALVFIDECQDLAPQSSESCSTDSIARLMKRGRKRGLCGVVITQRLSSTSKDVANLCTSVLIGTTAPLDASRACELMGLSSRDKKKFILLPTHRWMGRGQAISSEPLEFVTKFPQTREPDPESMESRPATSRSLTKLAKALRTIKPPESAKDPEKTAAPVIDQDAIDQARADERAQALKLIDPLIEMAKRLERDVRLLCRSCQHARGQDPDGPDPSDQQIVKVLQRVKPAAQRYKPKPADQAVILRDAPNHNAAKILAAMGWLESIGRVEMPKSLPCNLAGVSVRSGPTGDAWAWLASQGYIDQPGRGTAQLTNKGRSASNPPSRKPTLAELHAQIKAKLTDRQIELLDVVIANYPSSVSKAEACGMVGHSVRSGPTGDNWARLVAFGVIRNVGRGNVIGTQLLFPEGLHGCE